MNSLTGRIAIVALLFAGLAAPTAASEKQGSAARRAVPRQAAPRSQAPPRSEAPARTDSGRQEARGGRARGTDDQGRVRAPRGDDRRSESDEGTSRAPRQRAAAPPPPPTSASAPEARADSNAAGAAPAEEQQRRAQPRGGRDRGDNPSTGRAVPRDGRGDGDWRDGRNDRNDGRVGRRGGDSRVFVNRGRYYRGYRNNYYYPRRLYPYGYGAFGLGYFYYDPYGWSTYDPYWGRPGDYGGYYGGGYGGGYDYDTGELRLDVEPKHAEVYVDGYFAGHVDDFDGVFQALRLEEGGHRIEVVAPGFETLGFDVHIQPHRKTTYRGDLLRRP